MITTLEEATTHANHAHLKKYAYVIVAPDGCVYASNNKEQVTSLLTDEMFIIKGQIEKPIKKKVKENKEITE